MKKTLTCASEPRRPRDVRTSVTYRQLSEWLACPLAYRFKHVDGIRTTGTTTSMVGTMLRRVLTHYYSERNRGQPQVEEAYFARLRREWARVPIANRVPISSIAEERMLKLRTVGLLAYYLRQFGSEDPAPVGVAERTGVDLRDPHAEEDLGIRLSGEIDLVLPSDFGRLIVDVTVSSRTRDRLDIAQEAKLACLAFLFRHRFNDVEAGFEIRHLVLSRVPHIDIHRYPTRTEDHFRRFFAVVRSYLDDRRSGRFVYRPGWGCSACPFRDHACAEWIP